MQQDLITANGNSTPVYCAGGDIVIELVGNFSGATAKLQRQDQPGAAYYDYPNAATSYNANNSGVLTCGPGTYRMNFAGGGGGMSINCYVSPLVR